MGLTPSQVGRSRLRAPTSPPDSGAATSPVRLTRWWPQLSAPVRSAAAPPPGRPNAPGAASKWRAAAEADPAAGMWQRLLVRMRLDQGEATDSSTPRFRT
ncbi:hypothetical protein NDU88_005325 [Pleurodeles waltl]|uniref:Uncharacterized protein n=1 Tax=Pleurodeles waltl TaxID=8319 RepID=A0AAV7RKR9_PLEWA|nr:hypothetical protein NDU88_005325 [Pleurodeles waltl]